MNEFLIRINDDEKIAEKALIIVFYTRLLFK